MEDESPWIGPSPQGFCRIFGPMNFFSVGFFLMWAFLALVHRARAKSCGLDQIDTSTKNYKLKNMLEFLIEHLNKKHSSRVLIRVRPDRSAR